MATRTFPRLIFGAALALLAFLPGAALAQSGCAALQFGAQLTAGQWNFCFTSKQDALGFSPMNAAGGTFSGPVVTIASATNSAGFRLPPGVAPTSPVNGDLWSTSAGLFVRINGVTVGPLGVALVSGSAGCFVANATGGSAVPTCGTLTAAIDQALGTIRGGLITRGASVWAILSPGTSGGPLVSGGAGADLSYGTRSGNTTVFATTSGTLTTGNCVSIDASANLVAAGGPCTTGGGGGTVTSGTIGQIAFYATTGTTVSGLAAALSVAVGGTGGTSASGTLLDNISGFSTTGGLHRTGAGTYAFRTITGVANHITITNGDGVAGAPTIDLAAAVVFTGAFGTFTLEANALFIRDPSDTTKRAQFDLSSVGTGQTRSLKVPNANGIIAVSASGGVSLDPVTGNITPDAATNTNVWSATSAKLVDSGVLNSAGQIVTLTDATTIAVDMTTGINFTVTLGGNRTLGAPSNTQAGRSGCIKIVQDGTGTRTLAYNAVYKFPGGVAPVLSTAPGAIDQLCYIVFDSTHINSSVSLSIQ